MDEDTENTFLESAVLDRPEYSRLERMSQDSKVLWTDDKSNLFDVLREKDGDKYKWDINRWLESLGAKPIFDEE